jgi:xanthine dehydrogenase accessory factor
VGASLVVTEGGQVTGPHAPAGSPPSRAAAAAAAILEGLKNQIRPLALDALRRQTSRTERVTTADGDDVAVFLVIFGGVHIAAALVPLARRLGYRTIVADGRAAFISRERFPEADELILGWPAETFVQVGLDSATYVCVLSHDPKFDDPALEIALRSSAAYVGAIGSKKTQAARRERLRAAGFTPEELARLHGPIGLDLGGRDPAETALALLAEMTAVRYGKTGEGRREK